MRKTLLFVSLLCTVLGIYAQSATEAVNQRASIPISSPNVAALNKFVEFPVNHFTGQVDVSFPLYEIKLKNVTVPIRLKYHTGGIRVNEEASWVGLGWALDAGGVISHQINGLDDLVFPHYRIYGQLYPYTEQVKNENYDEYSILGIFSKTFDNYLIPKLNGESVYRRVELGYSSGYPYLQDHDVDGEPDLYIYNIGDYHGKFINWTNQSIDLSCNNVKFNQYVGNVHTADSIIATTPEGITYKFKDIEASFSLTGVSSPEHNNMRMNTAAYYLSEIIAPNGEQVKFYYKTFKQLMNENNWASSFPDYSPGSNPSYKQAGYYPSIPSLFEEAYYVSQYIDNIPQSGDMIDNVRIRAYSFTNTLFLEKIEFPNGSVEFVKSPRLDTYGLKLDKIYVKDLSGKKVKIFHFSYNYFEGAMPSYGYDVTTANNVGLSANINYPANYLKKRLKLTAFSEDNINESQSESYDFSYNGTSLPAKTSFAQDFWGYYNGYDNISLLPSYELYSSTMNLPIGFGQGKGSNYTKANRNVVPSRAKAATLTEIIYPTGGKTTFEFESNGNTSNSYNSSIERKYYTAQDYGNGFGRTIFTFNEQKNVDISVMLWRNNGSVNIGGTIPATVGSEYGDIDGWYAIIDKWDASRNKWIFFNVQYFWGTDKMTSSNNYMYSGSMTNQTFSSGKYRLTASFPNGYAQYGSLGGTMTQITVMYDSLNASTDYVGGLRVKKVTQIDPITNKSIEKNYQYANGVLATPLVFLSRTEAEYWRQLSMDQYEYHLGTKTSLNTNPTFPYSFAANGSLVGYRNVVEINSSGEIGKIEYVFKMEQDNMGMPMILLPPRIPTTSNIKNGTLSSLKIYDKNQKLLKLNSYTYSILNQKVYWGIKTMKSPYSDDIRYNYLNPPPTIEDKVTLYFYPIIQGKVLIKQEYEEDYRQGVIPPIQKTTNYEYNAYGMPLSKKTKDSASKDLTETYKYVTDFPQTTPYSQMISKNIITPVIETTIDHNGSITKQKTNYSQPYTNVFTPSSFQVQTGNNAIETRITFDKYDTFGNPNTINKDNTGNIIYLWSYKGLYPVAEIRNSDYTTVNAALATVGLTSIIALSTDADPDKAKLDQLRTVSMLANAHITTYKYSPLIGIVEVTSPAGVTTYYEYDAFGRLQTIKDENGKKVENYEYHYKN
ncbi:hypothetical protein AGMMS50262_03800 [Bacteroidia bacterium]|nr:hypothetical protein AGMMS50262_03800 [Bacteroidia bacterium]